MRLRLALLASPMVAACVPNPRNEIPAVLAAAVAELAARSPGSPTCVEREVLRFDENQVADAPPGFADLLASRFRGGGGVKGTRIAGVPVVHDARCYQLYGPVIAGDRALVRAIVGGKGVDVWLQRVDQGWHVEGQ